MSSKLYVSNLPFTHTEEELETLFGPFGQVESVNIIKDRDSGRSKGFAFVQMASHDEAQKAIEELDGIMVGDRELAVDEAKDKKKPIPGTVSGSRSGARGAGYYRNRD